MHKAQYEIKQLKSLLPKLGTEELETFLVDIKKIINTRNFPEKRKRETYLLKTINALVLPQEKLELYLFLREKRGEEALDKMEEKEFFSLIKEEQLLQVKRIHLLGQLAQLKGVSLREIASSLGINPPASA